MYIQILLTTTVTTRLFAFIIILLFYIDAAPRVLTYDCTRIHDKYNLRTHTSSIT